MDWRSSRPASPAKSELITRILSTDPDEVMPPPKSNRKLTAAQKQLLKHWVEQGAEWGEHWAFVAPKRRAGAGSPDPDRRDHAIRSTRLSLARLEKEGLKPAPEADKAQAASPRHARSDRPAADAAGARRLSRRPSPDAYEKAVDRLLASPRYGERMVWDWLDAARYADTNGYQGDPTRAMWPWRDWAIKALNDNMPFDQFTVEQLAGDLLPNPTHEQLIATGFHRNHMINGEGGRIPEESRVDYVHGPRRDDRHRLAGADVQLLPLPRPQVRPAHAARILPALRLLQLDRRKRRRTTPAGSRTRC